MERIGEYKIRRRIGEGGMGTVYEAAEQLSGRKVALKVLRPELADDPESRQRFLTEMQILARLEHPSIVRSLASFEDEGRFVLVLEHLDGESLGESLERDGALPTTQALHIARAIASAMEAAHQSEPAIVHRDLKPDNIMLLTDGRVKVTDFGIARVMAALPNTTRSTGTLQYMSPEQIDAQDVGPASDLYSLGLVLYEMLTGAPPFQSTSPRELLNLQCTASPPPLDDALLAELPEGTAALIDDLLAKAPGDRPASASDVVVWIDTLLPSLGEAPPTTSLPARIPRSGDALAPRHDIWRTLAIGLLCFVLGAVVLFLTDPIPKAEQASKKNNNSKVQKKKPAASTTKSKQTLGASHMTPDNAVMLRIPAGPFKVGTNPNTPKLMLGEYYIDRTEVSVTSFQACVQVGSCKRADFTPYSGSQQSCNYDNKGRGAHPMNCVSAAGAERFCHWRSTNDSEMTYRLPAHDEWEKAARGAGGLDFPWKGQTTQCLHGQIGGCGRSGTSGVGEFDHDVSPYQVRDVFGNVSEWVRDTYRAKELNDRAISRAKTAIRGSNWLTPAGSFSSLGVAYQSDQLTISNVVGFRCVGRSRTPR